MADYEENYESLLPEDTPDISMAGADVPVVEISRGATTVAMNDIADNTEAEEDGALPFQEGAMDDLPARTTYIDYLKSPVIGLLVGQGDEQALLTAHQGLLNQSPWFAEACARFSDDVSVSSN